MGGVPGRLAVACAMAGLVGAGVMTAQAANVVFEGTVTKTSASSLPNLKPSDRTVIVRVTQIVQKPESLPLAVGDDVTVQLTTPNAAPADTKRTFRTVGWLYGKTLALREVNDQRPTSSLAQRVQSAEVVVTGQVTEVRPGPQQRPTKVSEHNPTQWQEAVIHVGSGLKGSVGQNIVVRVPQSQDVKWRDMPALTQGKAFTLLLHRDRVSGSPTARLSGASVPAYTVLSPQDVLVGDQSQTVKRAMSPARGNQD